MERPKEIEAILKHLRDEWSVDYVILIKYIQSLETKAQCLDEIIAYMKDDTVTWRDISDDIINDILKDHDLK